MKFKIEGCCETETLLFLLQFHPSSVNVFCVLRSSLRFRFLFALSLVHAFPSLPVAGHKLLASPDILGPPRREIREIWGPDIACIYSSSSSSSLLPSCALPTKILRGLSAYAFVTCVSQAATATAAVVVTAHPYLMARRKALPRRAAVSEASYF